MRVQQGQPNDITRDSKSKCEVRTTLFLNAEYHVSPKADPLIWWQINSILPIRKGILNWREHSHIALHGSALDIVSDLVFLAENRRFG